MRAHHRYKSGFKMTKRFFFSANSCLLAQNLSSEWENAVI